MDDFAHTHVDGAASNAAVDGSSVTPLLRIPDGASTAVWALRPGEVSNAVVLPDLDEIWFVLSGLGRMWRRRPCGKKTIIDLTPGTCLTVPRGTEFQFRCTDPDEPLRVFGVTLPPYPVGALDAVRVIPGPVGAFEDDA